MTARLTANQLAELRAIDSPTIANAIEYFSVRPRVAGYCGANVRCLTPDAGYMLGYAVTCRGDSTTETKTAASTPPSIERSPKWRRCRRWW